MEVFLHIPFRVFVAAAAGALEGLCYWPFDFLHETVAQRLPRWALMTGYLAAGAAIGILTLLVFPQAWLSERVLKVLNLGIAPLVGGTIGYSSAKFLYRPATAIEPREHFWSGFWFAFGLSAVRFVNAMN